MIFKDHSELTDDEFELLKTKVLEARDLSYSPYSKFRVGCCVITASNQYIQGANIENASYGACICAERSTISSAVLRGERKFKAIAISSDAEQITPCGICRQFIREFSTGDVPIYMFNPKGDFVKVYLKDLLPMSFGPEDLGLET